MATIKRYDLEGYLWREYDFNDRVYRITRPVAFYWKPGAVTHRVLDDHGVVHIVPAPGFQGCVLRYEKEAGYEPVVF